MEPLLVSFLTLRTPPDTGHTRSGYDLVNEYMHLRFSVDEGLLHSKVSG